MRLTDPAGLDAHAVLAVARGELVPELGDDLIGWLDGRRARMLAALDAGGPVYGVTTGMGALSELGLGEAARARHSEALLTARAAGGPPWLSPAETRAVLAVRLRTFLNGDAAVSAALCGGWRNRSHSACCLHFRAGRRAWRAKSWASRISAQR